MKGLGLLLISVVMAGCGSNSRMIPYNITTQNCFCERFEVKDPDVSVSYVFVAWYRVDEAITTQIVVDLINESRDTLDLSLAHIKVSSRNIPYMYNDKFLPIHILHVLPGEKRTLTLNGESIKRESGDPWLKIAGEEMVLTLKGMRMHMRTLDPLVVTFVPQNPKLRANMEGCPDSRL